MQGDLQWLYRYLRAELDATCAENPADGERIRLIVVDMLRIAHNLEVESLSAEDEDDVEPPPRGADEGVDPPAGESDQASARPDAPASSRRAPAGAELRSRIRRLAAEYATQPGLRWKLPRELGPVLPTLASASRTLGRWHRAGVDVPPPAPDVVPLPPSPQPPPPAPDVQPEIIEPPLPGKHPPVREPFVPGEVRVRVR